MSKPTEEQKAILELMFADKKKEKKKEDETIDESTMLHGSSYECGRVCVCVILFSSFKI